MQPETIAVQADGSIGMPSPMDFLQFLGGDHRAVTILALAVAVVALWRRVLSVQDGRLADMKEANKAHQALSREMQLTLDALEKAIRGRNG